jgi:glycerophosphoryl diester phosphodiesterase
MKIIGHRGASGLAPENTLKAFEKALEHHVDEIEFDVRVTADGIPILHHDPSVVDASGNHLVIAGTELNLLLGHNPDIALFEAVFGVVNHNAKLLIEIKPGVSIKPIIEVVKSKLANGWQTKEMTLTSFDFKLLTHLHETLPEIETQIIEGWSGVRASMRMKKLGSKKVSINQKWLWWGFIRGFKNSDYQLYAYKLNDVRKAKRWAKYGLAGVITDYPDRFEK